MCGIAAKFRLNGDKRIDNQSILDLGLALKAINHRGPDDTGVCGVNFSEGYIRPANTAKDLAEMNNGYDAILGFNRLSIKDLSLNGHQPMISDDKKKVLLFNGEIYNDLELRSELIEAGIDFRGTSDTEIILRLYEKCGFNEMASKLNGMFAIILVDIGINRVFVARDRFGIKPMYIAWQNGSLYCGSEIKALLQFKEFEKDLDLDTFNACLIFAKQKGMVLFKDVESVTPGTFISFSPDDEGFKTFRFFDIDDYQIDYNKYSANISDDEVIEEFEAVLKDAVKRQMISDVKIGCQLSGGVDSSLITYYVADMIGYDLEGYSIIDETTAYEKKYIDKVQDITGIKVNYLTTDEGFFANNIDKIVWYNDMPLHKAYSCEYFKISKEAKKNCTVLLSGEGADEIAGGYSRMENTYLQPFITSLGISNSIVRSYNSFAEYAIMQDSTYTQLTTKNYDSSHLIKKQMDIINKFFGSNFVKYLKYDITMNLPELLLRQDKMMMANSIENRVPFLDNEVVDFLFNLPEKYLIRFADKSPANLDDNIYRWFAGKYVIKQLATRLFGRDFAYRKKTSMAFDERRIIGSDSFQCIYKDRIEKGIRERGLIDVGVINNWYENIDKIPFSCLQMMWRAIALELWCQIFVDKNQYGNVSY